MHTILYMYWMLFVTCTMYTCNVCMPVHMYNAYRHKTMLMYTLVCSYPYVIVNRAQWLGVVGRLCPPEAEGPEHPGLSSGLLHKPGRHREAQNQGWGHHQEGGRHDSGAWDSSAGEAWIVTTSPPSQCRGPNYIAWSLVDLGPLTYWDYLKLSLVQRDMPLCQWNLKSISNFLYIFILFFHFVFIFCSVLFALGATTIENQVRTCGTSL